MEVFREMRNGLWHDMEAALRAEYAAYDWVLNWFLGKNNT